MNERIIESKQNNLRTIDIDPNTIRGSLLNAFDTPGDKKVFRCEKSLINKYVHIKARQATKSISRLESDTIGRSLCKKPPENVTRRTNSDNRFRNSGKCLN